MSWTQGVGVGEIGGAECLGEGTVLRCAESFIESVSFSRVGSIRSLWLLTNCNVLFHLFMSPY